MYLKSTLVDPRKHTTLKKKKRKTEWILNFNLNQSPTPTLLFLVPLSEGPLDFMITGNTDIYLCEPIYTE